MGRRRSRQPAEPRGKWSVAIKERFLALLRETGNAAATLRIVGHANMFRKRRRRDPEFAALWAEAVAAADARLGRATGRFPGTPDPLTPSSSGTGPSPGRAQEAPNSPQGRGGSTPVERLDAGMGTVTSDCPPADAAALLRPGPKKMPKERGHVIRRARGGRTQIALARACEMTSEAEADFLARLKATGNFSGSARAVGFQPASLFDRYRKWPAFARACDAAIAEAEIVLDFALVAHAHRLLGTGTRDCPAGDEAEEMGTVTSDCPQEADKAMRILAFIDRRRGGRTTRGRRKGPPERSFDEAVASVLAKIAAIERHEKRKGAGGAGMAPHDRHCEERSDEAIHSEPASPRSGLLPPDQVRGRNDGPGSGG